MIKRVIEVSHARTHLSIQLGQLLVRREGREQGRIPCEDIGVLLVHHSGVTYTHAVFTELLAAGAAVVLCGHDHHPTGLLLPVESNTLQAERFREQVNASKPLKKRLWKQIVQAKIGHQAHNVRDETRTYQALKRLRTQVRSGDPANIEARAARLYWRAFLQGVNFRRDPDGAWPNNLLNYGYMVLRAAVARALCSAGLLPTLGVHHRNRYNAFCLADDLIEPFRGFVEARVRGIVEAHGTEGTFERLDQTTKACLLKVLYQEVRIGGFSGPLMVGLHRTAASLVRCFAREQRYLELPQFED